MHPDGIPTPEREWEFLFLGKSQEKQGISGVRLNTTRHFSKDP